MMLAAVAESSFLVDLLEKGGLPALVTGVFFLILILMMRNTAKKDADEMAERKELMKAYKALVDKFVDLSQESTRAISVLSERVGKCPLRGQQVELVEDTLEDPPNG